MAMNLEDEIANEMAKQKAQEIDFELLTDVLIACGWTKVTLDNGALTCTGLELHDWRERNLTGRWKAHNKVWLFENSQDAVVFTLKWR